MSSLNQNPAFNYQLPNPAPSTQFDHQRNQPTQQNAAEQQPQEQQQPAAQQPARERANNNNNDIGDREDDWLSTLHNIVSFMVLFSIIYYYSSLERFLVIFAIVIVLIL